MGSGTMAQARRGKCGGTMDLCSFAPIFGPQATVYGGVGKLVPNKEAVM